MYAYKYESSEKRIAKGVAKPTIQRDLTFDMYKECLFSKEPKNVRVNLIQSKGHRLEMYRKKKKKVGLSPYDSKHYYLDATTSLPYFHYQITSGEEPMLVD